MARTQKTYQFRQGDEFTLDAIFEIQGLGGGGWCRLDWGVFNQGKPEPPLECKPQPNLTGDHNG